MSQQASILVFTDLDGTLLDADTYSWQPALPALELLRKRAIPLILASSKTRAEMEPIRYQLGLHEPFIVENGGALFMPKGYFPFALSESGVKGPYQVIEIGTPYVKLRSKLREIGQALGCKLKGFGDMSAEEIRERTGLTQAEAVLAKQREYDEPFAIEGSGVRLEDVEHLAKTKGLTCTRGGRFHHLHGPNDKGRACRYLIDWYGRSLEPGAGKLLTVGIGDSVNDLPMLAEVDRRIVVSRPDGTYDPAVRLPGLIKAPGIGPAGWRDAMLEFLASAAL
jgi:mannosyl-3-phosphoglycerate phosphatase